MQDLYSVTLVCAFDASFPHASESEARIAWAAFASAADALRLAVAIMPWRIQRIQRLHRACASASIAELPGAFDAVVEAMMDDEAQA